jgi:hypothetical protein
MRELDVEFENVRAAWHHAVELALGEELVRAGYALMCYCDHRGRRVEGLELMQEALAVPAVAAEPRHVHALSTSRPGSPIGSTVMRRQRRSACARSPTAGPANQRAIRC